MEEIWDLVDESGRSVNIKWSRKDHDKIPKGLFHPAVEVWVKIGDKLLLSRRHPDKTEGLKYDCPGGAVVSGEDFSLGAIRELYEEVGISAGESDIVYLGSHTHGVCYAVCYLLVLEEIPRLVLQPTEVVGYTLVTKDELEKMADEVTAGTYRRYLIFKDKIF